MNTSVGSAFRTWICTQHPNHHEVTAISADSMYINASTVRAEINIYPFDGAAEIVEYRINRIADNEPLFFLHFTLDDLDRAQELFSQMVEALIEHDTRTTTHIMLCCTSALTTSMFASKMSEAARTLSLDYDFDAMPVDRAIRVSELTSYAAILLAPQVSHMRSSVRKAHPGTPVFEIPAKVYGSYDAGAALQLVMHALRDRQDANRGATSLKAVRDLTDNRRVLVITQFTMRDYHRLGYRLYDKGVGITEGTVLKPRLDFRDVDDLIDTLALKSIDVNSLDAIAVAVPGVTYKGSVTLPDIVSESYDLGVHLSQRLGIPVYVDNNCNAAAVGCYVSQKEVENLIFYRHAFGHEAGGFGTVIDGTLLKGRHNLAGEPKYFEASFDFTTSFEEAIWTEDGMHELAFNVICASMTLVSPDAIYLAVDTVDDAEEFRRLLLEIFEDEYVPSVHIVKDYVERVYLGELAMTLQKLRNPAYRSLGVRSY